MNMDEQKLTYEQFKADILQWKDAHREEYRRFAKMMADGNEVQYLAVCRAIFRQLPGIKKEWQMSWCDDSTDGFQKHRPPFQGERGAGEDRGTLQETEGRRHSPASDHILGQNEIHFQTEPENTLRDLVRPSCIELAVLRQELRGHGGHGQQAGRASQGRERREDGLFHCRQADYRGVHKERLPHAGGLEQTLRHEGRD